MFFTEAGRYPRSYFNRRRERKRQKLYQMLGGKCARCGSTDRLEFDHKNPEDKNFIISNKIDAPMSVLKKEVEKCELLCRKCHRKKTLKNNEFGSRSSHGTIWRYKKYKCRCDECRAAMREYNRERRLKLLEEKKRLLEEQEDILEEETLEAAAHRIYKVLTAENPYREGYNRPQELYSLIIGLAEASKQNGLYASMSLRDKINHDQVSNLAGEIQDLFGYEEEVSQLVNTLHRTAYAYGVTFGSRLDQIQNPDTNRWYGYEFEEKQKERLDTINQIMHEIMRHAFGNAPTFLWGG